MSVLRAWRYAAEAEAWRRDALCPEYPDAPWFPERGESTGEAKLVCFECKVRAECLDYAIANNIQFGIWGGMSERQRRSERRRRAARRRQLNEVR